MALSSLPFRVLLIRNARLCRIYPKKCPMYFSLTQRYRWICSVKVNLCIKFSTFLTGKFYTTMAGFLFPLLIHKSACGRASSIFRVDATHTSSFPEFATREIGEGKGRILHAWQCATAGEGGELTDRQQSRKDLITLSDMRVFPMCIHDCENCDTTFKKNCLSSKHP